MSWILRIAAVAAVLGALVASALPVHLAVVDRTEEPIGCGSVFSPDNSTATREDSWNAQQHDLMGPPFVQTQYVSDCARQRAARGRTATWVAALGGLVLAGVVGAELFSSTRVRRA